MNDKEWARESVGLRESRGEREGASTFCHLIHPPTAPPVVVSFSPSSVLQGTVQEGVSFVVYVLS